MSREFLNAVAERRAEIERHWKTLLHLEPFGSALAHPDTLQYLVPEKFVETLRRAARTNRKVITLEQARAALPACDCGNNPFRAFFRAAEQAFSEAAVLIQAEQPPEQRSAIDIAELVYAVRCTARAEIDAFCGACAHRGRATHCRFAVAAV